MGNSHWQYGQLSAFLLLIVGATLAGCGKVQPVSDIWSLGATFYTMLCGESPREFGHGKDPMEVILQGEIIPLKHRNRSVPARIAAVIDRSLANEIPDRFQTASDMRKALSTALRTEGIL